VKKRTRLVALAALLVTLALGAIAYAYWTQGGIGSGPATAGTTTAITVNQTGSPTGLYPGGPAAPLSGTFTNPNSVAVHISSVSAVVDPFSVQTDGAKPACTEADFVIGGSGTGAIVVPAGPGVVGSWSGITVRLVDGAGNQDNCKGVGITIDYTANP
jgi:hypothetical protein